MATDRKYGSIDIPGKPDDMPVFVLLASDALSVGIIARYRNKAATSEKVEPTKEWLASLDDPEDSVMADFHAWQKEHPELVKFPD